jgi:MFS family permease
VIPTGGAHGADSGVRLGLRANWPQFVLLVVINGFVGAMVGLERTVIPLLGASAFGLRTTSAVLSFLIGFGVAKALANFAAGGLADAVGRKPVLVAGWLAGLPAPFMIILAPTWGWVIAANVLLGINQGLCWSTTVIMKIDLAGPRQRGLAMGLNEFSGYLAVSLSALLAGYLAAARGLRPVPLYPAVLFAAAGLVLSLFWVRETRAHVRHEAGLRQTGPVERPSLRRILLESGGRNPSLFAASQAGMVNNLNDAMAWGLVPIVLAATGLRPASIGVIAAVYPGVWSIGQLITGPLSDRWGRKEMIVSGMWIQAIGVSLFAIGRTYPVWLGGAVLMGVGTALVYPTLLAAVSDVAHPDWRGAAIGVYRLWRDSGYAIGALLTGVAADLLGPAAAIWIVAALTFFSGVVVLTRMRASPAMLHDPSGDAAAPVANTQAHSREAPTETRPGGVR